MLPTDTWDHPIEEDPDALRWAVTFFWGPLLACLCYGLIGRFT